jgi:hypothetical protein
LYDMDRSGLTYSKALNRPASSFIHTRRRGKPDFHVELVEA